MRTGNTLTLKDGSSEDESDFQGGIQKTEFSIAGEAESFSEGEARPTRLF